MNATFDYILSKNRCKHLQLFASLQHDFSHKKKIRSSFTTTFKFFGSQKDFVKGNLNVNEEASRNN